MSVKDDMEQGGDEPLVYNDDAAKAMSKARTRLLLKHPFFGMLTMNLVPTQSNSLPTLATDGKHLFYKADYVLGLNDKQLAAAVAHETLHVAFRHTSERRKRKPFEIWNIACDAFINALIQETNDLEIHSEWVTASKLPWKKGMALNEQTVLQHTAEQIFDRLDFKVVEISVGGCGLGDSKDGEEQSQSGSKTSKSIEDQMWNGRVKAAYDEAAKRGQAPAGMTVYIDEIVNPKKDWRELLAQWMSVDRNDYGYRPPDRRFAGGDIIMPDLVEEEKVSDIVIAIDTSGSISEKMLKHFVTEAMAIRSMGTRIWLIYCDAAIHKNSVFLLDEIDSNKIPNPVGRGGTSFVPVFEYIKKHPDMNVKSLVYLTDSEGDCPKTEPGGYPTLWVVPEPYMSRARQNLPWGRIVEYPLSDPY